LKPKEIAELFFVETGNNVSNNLVKRTLKSMDFKYRKLSKNLAIGQYDKREEQFKIIFHLVTIMSLDSPVISIDCKKKERLGNLYREGKSYTTGAVEVFDHDYHYLGQGAVIPHGIFDIQNNEGYITIGSSHETATFIALILSFAIIRPMLLNGIQLNTAYLHTFIERCKESYLLIIILSKNLFQKLKQLLV